MTDEPTLGELMRRLEEAIRQLGALATQMAEDRKHVAMTYVRQDVYLAQRQADQAVVADAATDLRTAEAKIDTRLAGLATKIEQTETKRINNMRANIGTTLAFITVLLGFAALLLNRGVL